jgi:hypothetical protein
MKPEVKEREGPKPSRRAPRRRARPAAEAPPPIAPVSKVELRPYGPQLRISLFGKIVLTAGALGFCFLYGLVFAFFAPNLMMQMLAPLVVLAALVLWALPETGKAPVRYLEILIFGYMVAQSLWPNYLALVLPGLPWITVLRVAGVSLALVLLTCVSVSPRFRSELGAVLKAAPLLSRCLFLFAALQALSVFASSDRGSSANLFLNVLTGWYSPFLATCFICMKDGRVERFVGLLCLTAIILAGLAFWEHHLGHLPWLGHIPSFLQVNDPNVQRFLAGNTRADGVHRVQATFTTSLALSEYLAISLPFLLHFGAVKYPMPLRVAAYAAVPIVILAIVQTQARTGMIGVLVALSAYPIVRTFLYWRRNPQDLAASSILFFSPVLVAGALTVAYIVPGLHVRIFGAGSTAYSNDSRQIQMNMGMPKIYSHPWGYGIGRGSDTLQYSGSFSDVYSIDIYPLRLALEYGVVGFLVYYTILFAAFKLCAMPMLDGRQKTTEEMLFIPIGVSLLAIALMQIVFALEDNQSVLFVIFGILAAMTFRYAKRRKATTRSVVV